MRSLCFASWPAIVMVPVIMVAVWSLPQTADAQQSRSLDDELFDELGADPIDEFDRELFGPEDPIRNPADPPDATLRDRMQRELGPAAEAEDGNPLLSVARRMREAEDQIGQGDAGTGTQTLQKQIVSDLDRLIEQARKRCKQCKAGACKPGAQSVASRTSPKSPGPPKPGTSTNKPAATSNAKPGQATPQRPDMAEMRDVMKQLWGELPQRDREQMLQSPPEEFLPKYELMIEQYFRRLTEGKGQE
ncbi:MAG: hypothetical protein V3R99_07330 [Thermoguttaceae bacterium]